MLDAQAMREVTGSGYYISGLYTKGTMMLQPAGYVQGFAAGLRRQDVRIYEQTAVTAFSRESGDWQVQTTGGTLATPRIILANNGHLESFGIARGKLMQLFLYASMTPELSAEDVAKIGGQDRWGVIPADPMGTTVRRIDTAQGGNRIITRTCASLRPGMEASARDIARASAVQARKFDTRFPSLAGMKMQYQWAGHLCLTLNGVSVTREVDEGVFSACAQNGLGSARGTLTGIAAAEGTLGKSSVVTDYFLAEAEPKPLPPQPFATWGANAYLRWKEWKAGRE
jgi:glycine/D-amino acid oxidase-like deaminating enzyme